MWPESPDHPLAPYGREVFVRRGIAYGDGRTEWVSLGYYRITHVEQESPTDGPIRISGRDRMAALIDARLVAPRSFPRNATYGQVLDDLVREVYPWAVIEWDDDNALRQLGRPVVCEQDRFAFLDDLVTALGKIWFWDHRGILVIRTPPSATNPVVDLTTGEGGVIVSMVRRLSNEGLYNAVVAEGDSSYDRPPIRAVAFDNDPNSPTYWYGDFGKVPLFYASPLLVTQAQAQACAETLLRRHLGVPYTIDLSAVPNPALEPLDAVRVTYGSALRPDLIRSEVHVLDRLTIPLTADGAMTAATRQQTTGIIGFG